MKRCRLRAYLVLVLPLIALGCANSGSPQEKAQETEATIKANLAKLDPDDRERAEEQKYCAVETANRLGAMGKPIKVTIKDETVFLCCKGCEKTAKKDPDKTLARVEELRIRAALEQLDPADRKMAKEQKFCATDPESLLGSMGKPVKITLKDQVVFLCCKGCEKTARKDVDKTLADVKKMKAANAEAAKAKDHE
jgi:hypothetical protein